MDESSQSSFLYSGYEDWKGWTEDQVLPEVPSHTNHDYFSREFHRAKVPPGSKVLEIGFGNGEFLHWAEFNGYNVLGVEVNERLYQLGKKRGFQVFLGELTGNVEGLGDDFDVVVAFDVLEHLFKDTLLDYFDAINRCLKVGGRVIARFPNGQSPFGSYSQYGDMTHQTVLTGLRLEQIGLKTGFTMEGCYNSIRIHGKRRRIKKILKYLLRDLLECLLTHLYHGKRIPWDCTLTCVLVKKQT